MQLSVKLRDRFQNDTVTIKVDGTEVFHRAGVTSDLAISFADSVAIPVSQPTVVLEVAVEGGPTERKQIRVPQTPFVDVWMDQGRLDLRASPEDTPML